MNTREFDIIVYGATGFTGRLVAEYLSQQGHKRWAMAGRSATKLAEVRDAIGAPGDTPLVTADADDPASLRAMCNRARTILTTVGPYQLYGSDLVAACVETGTSYVDLSGEPAWMREMIDAHAAAAEASGARIVFSCGFDSIPFDLGVWKLQQIVIARTGKPAARIKCRVRKMQGGASGGTVASMKATMAAAAKNPKLIALLTSSFALTPGFDGPSQPAGLIPEYDRDEGYWAVPFVMAPINTKNVHRSNFLLHHAYGTDFTYDEMMLTTIGEAGKAMAEAAAKMNPFGDGKMPAPGEGPSKEAREAGFYEILFTAILDDGKRIKLVVKGDRDPGYGSTSKMIAESALALNETASGGGIFTPGGLMAAPLLARLEANAGLSFSEEA
ncbi:MAG: saccharopine dehydrogenase family protein [Sphingomonadaceae bacterium]